MRKGGLQFVLIAAVVAVTSGAALRAHYALDHADPTPHAGHDHGHCHGHGHPPAHEEPGPPPDAPADPSHDCHVCDLLLTFTAAELEIEAAVVPVAPAGDRIAITQSRPADADAPRSCLARAPPVV